MAKIEEGISQDNGQARLSKTWIANALEWVFVAAVQQMPAGHKRESLRVYGVPRGGVVAAMMHPRMILEEHPGDADIILDDIIDGGATMQAHLKHGKPFFSLYSKLPMRNLPKGVHAYYHALNGKEWVVFPWEVGSEDNGAETNVARLLQALGEDPDREGMRETPKRFVKAMRELTAGYHEDPKVHLAKNFDITDSGARFYDQIVLSADLPFVSLCEHHMLPFSGIGHLAYIPSPDTKRVVGLSKLARVLDGYSKRFQVQERLTVQIADAMEEVLKPLGVAVILRATHSCQCYRGVRKAGKMVTSAMHGVFKSDAAARAELMQLIGV